MARPARSSAASRSNTQAGEPHHAAGDPRDDPGDPHAVARTICLRLLDQRARTRAELAEALRRRGVPDDAAAAVLDRFTEVGLIDDTALADSFAAAVHRERGLARRAVAAKLRHRGVADDDVAAALSQIDPASERARARQLVQTHQRAMAALPPEVQQRRLVGLLARKGYPAGLAFETVRTVLRELDAERDDTADADDSRFAVPDDAAEADSV